MKLSRNQRYLLASLLLLLIGGGAGYAFRAQAQAAWHSYRFESAMRGAMKCTEGTDVITCARPFIKTLMEMRPANDVLDQLSDRIVPIRCHYLGHIIGQELYRQSQSDEIATSQCSRSCESACLHGAVGEAFMTTAGISEDDFDPKHLSVEELRKIGGRLCESGSCHGVGHALFQAYDSFAPALELCREVATGARALECARGTFMEYSNIISARSVWESYSKETDVNSLYGICAEIEGVARDACYYYFPGMILGVLQRQGTVLSEQEKISTMQGLCDRVPEADRTRCVSGVGVHFYSYLLMRSPEALRICEGFASLSDQASCAFGMLSMSLETGGIEDKFTYCKAFAEATVRESCFQSIFYITNFRGKPQNAEELCKGESLCLTASTRSALDPFDFISARLP